MGLWLFLCSQVLVETNKMDLRATDRFFHRKDYVNRETFTNHEPAGLPQNWKAQWVDNLCESPRERP